MKTLHTILTVAKKELVDLFRDRKTAALGLLLGPILFPALILGMGSMAEKRAKTQLESTLELPVVGAERAPNMVGFLESQNMSIEEAPEDLEARVRDQTHEVVLVIPEDYPEQWRASRAAKVELVYDSSRRDSDIPVNRVRSALQQYGQQVGALRIVTRGVSPGVTVGVQVATRDVATPEAKRGMVLAFLRLMTEHVAAYGNTNIFVYNPLWWILLLAMLVARRSPRARGAVYFIATGIALLASFGVVAPFLPGFRQGSFAVIALAAPLAITAAWIIRERHRPAVLQPA